MLGKEEDEVVEEEEENLEGGERRGVRLKAVMGRKVRAWAGDLNLLLVYSHSRNI